MGKRIILEKYGLRYDIAIDEEYKNNNSKSEMGIHCSIDGICK